MSQDLVYPFLQPPPSGESLEVAPGVLWLRMRLPFQLDHVNLWLIDAGDSWCIIDCGYADETTRAAWETLLAGLDKPVSRILVTHFHPDHLGLAVWLQNRTRAKLLMTTGEFLTAHAVWNEVGGHGARFMVEQFGAHGLCGERLEAYRTRGSGYRKSMPELPQSYARIATGDEIQLGQQRWRVVGGGGHSPEHGGLHCAALGLFISGDMLLPRISTNISVMAATPDDDSLSRYLAALADYRSTLAAETLVLPAHGLPFIGIATRVGELEGHHAERLQLVESACSQPMTAAGLMAILFPRPLDTHQIMFALGETIAHANCLLHRGRLRRLVDADGTIRFARSHTA